MNHTFIEREMLRAYTDDLQSDGFEVIVEPSPKVLPDFLRDSRPDAIAISPTRKLVIEARSRRKEADDIITRYEDLLKTHEDWEFKLIWIEDSERIFDTLSASLQQIKDRNDQISELIDKGSIDAALLLAWANLEGLGRLSNPQALAKPQSTSRLLEALASSGIITPTEADQLREIAPKRNAVAHGDMTRVVLPEDVTNVLRTNLNILEQLNKDIEETTARYQEDKAV